MARSKWRHAFTAGSRVVSVKGELHVELGVDISDCGDNRRCLWVRRRRSGRGWSCKVHLFPVSHFISAFFAHGIGAASLMVHKVTLS